MRILAVEVCVLVRLAHRERGQRIHMYTCNSEFVLGGLENRFKKITLMFLCLRVFFRELNLRQTVLI